MASLQFEGVEFAYSKNSPSYRFNLSVTEGEFWVVQGESGSGKSTFLALALGLLRPTEGRVSVAGENLARLKEAERAQLRRDRIGTVFQFGELLPDLTALENVMMPALWHGTSRAEAEERSRSLLGTVGLSDGELTRAAGLLSGGEQQRVAVARALVNDPVLVLADEPTGALDEKNRDSVLDLLSNVTTDQHRALVVVSHDSHVSARADRRARLINRELVGE